MRLLKGISLVLALLILALAIFSPSEILKRPLGILATIALLVLVWVASLPRHKIQATTVGELK